jgi:hypothetical protein
VDIHPAAKLGRGLMLDHATGVVIGETAVVGIIDTSFCSYGPMSISNPCVKYLTEMLGIFIHFRRALIALLFHISRNFRFFCLEA